MSGILTQAFKSKALVDMFNSFDTPADYVGDFTQNYSSLYWAIAKNTPWDTDANGAYEDEAGFIIPEEATTDIDELQSNILAYKRIQQDDISIVVEKRVYQGQSIYNNGDVIINQYNYVYQCIDNNGGGQSLSEPNGTIPAVTADGYQWQFLYDISSEMMTKFSDQNWIPVMFGSRATTRQRTYGDMNVVSTIEADNIMVSVIITEDDGAFVDNVTFRQSCLITDPVAADGSRYVLADNLTPSQVRPGTGNIIYLNNHKPVIQYGLQIETTKIIIGFGVCP